MYRKHEHVDGSVNAYRREGYSSVSVHNSCEALKFVRVIGTVTTGCVDVGGLLVWFYYVGGRSVILVCSSAFEI